MRERLEDVPLVATHYLQVFAAEMGMRAPVFAPKALALLTRYDFPGNVRELRNLVERALIECGGESILPEHLHLLSRGGRAMPAPKSQGLTADLHDALPLNLAEAEEILIQRALQQTGGNIADAARLLGVHRTRIYRKIALEETVPE